MSNITTEKSLRSKFRDTRVEELIGPMEYFVLIAVSKLGQQANAAGVLERIKSRSYEPASIDSVKAALQRMGYKGYLTSVKDTTHCGQGRPRKIYELSDDGKNLLQKYKLSLKNLDNDKPQIDPNNDLDDDDPPIGTSDPNNALDYPEPDTQKIISEYAQALKR